MISALTFVVGFSLKQSKTKNAIALDPVAMELLGVKEGDKVQVTRGQLLGLTIGRAVELAVIKGNPEDFGKRIVRLSEDVQGFSHGDTVILHVI